MATTLAPVIEIVTGQTTTDNAPQSVVLGSTGPEAPRDVVEADSQTIRSTTDENKEDDSLFFTHIREVIRAFKDG
jgi:hypothetical protein